MEEGAMGRLEWVGGRAGGFLESRGETATPAMRYIQVTCEAANTVRNNRRSSAKLAVLEATLTYAVAGVGAPSYTSGAHLWNGAAATLKNRPTAINTNPSPARYGISWRQD